MSDPESGWKWWIRYVLVPLIGGGGVIASLVAFLSRSPVAPPGPDPAEMARQRAFALRDVQDVVYLWGDSLLGGDVDRVMQVSGDPVYLGKDLIQGKEKLRDEYVHQAEEAKPKHIHLKVLQVRALADPSARNILDDEDLRGLRLTKDDFAATTQFTTGKQGTVLVRRSGDRYEVIGAY